MPEFGDKASDLLVTLQAELLKKNLPGVRYEVTPFKSERLFSKEREYLVLRHPDGGRITIYLSAYGRDLYISWDLWLTIVLNWRLIRWMLGASIVFGPPFWLVTGFAGGLNIVVAVALSAMTFVLNVALLVTCVGLLGKFLKNNWLQFLLAEVDEFAIQEIRALMLVAHKALLHSVDTVGIAANLLRVKERFGGRRMGVLI